MLGKKVLSIDIGTHSIKIVVGKHQNKIVNVEKAFTIPTPLGAYNDGNIEKAELIIEAIKDFLNEKKIKVKNVIFTVESSSTITREITLPMVKNEELESMIRFEIEQYLPIDFNEYVIQYKILEEFKEVDVKKHRILVVALPKDIVKAFFDLNNELKLKPVALDIHTNGISKIFETEMRVGEENYSLSETVAVIDIGHSSTNINIINNGILEFNRQIQSGGKYITDNIASSYNLSIDEAEDRKIEHGDLELSFDSLAKPTMINELVKQNVDIWVEEIQRVFRYYTSRKMGNRVDKIFLHGGSSKIKELNIYVESYINLPTFRIDSMGSVKFSDGLENCDLSIFLNSIAVIIRR